MRRRKKKARLLTPIEARLELISRLEGEIDYFEKKISKVEVQLGEAEAEVRELTRRKSSEPGSREWCDNRISAEQNIILGFHSRLAEYRDAIERRRRKILALYDEIDCIQHGVEIPEREEEEIEDL